MHRRALLRAAGTAALATALPIGTARDRVAATGGYEPLGQVEVNGAAEAVVGADGETVYVAATNGFVTVDVTDPTEPAILAEERTLAVDGQELSNVLDVKTDGERLLVVNPANRTQRDVFHGLVCYDVSDPGEPVRLAAYETGYHIHNCFLDGETAYAVRNEPETTALEIFDVSDGIEPIGQWSFLEHEPGWNEVSWRVRYLHDVFVRDDVAVLAHWNAGTILLDVSDPAEPAFISRVQDTDRESTLALSETEAQQGLPGNDHYAAVDERGELLAVGREAWATGGDEPDGPGGIDLYDVSDPVDPTLVSTIDPPRADAEGRNDGLWTTAHNFELREGELYSSWYQGGVAIHDVSDPTAPRVRARWRDSERAGFWTTRVLEPGETVVASTTPLIPNAATEGGLYTFPIADGSQVDVPDDGIRYPQRIEDGTASVGSLAAIATSLGGMGLALAWLARRARADPA